MKRQTGFTLVELVIVIAVLGILAGLAIPYFMEAREEAAKKECLANRTQILRMFHAQQAVGYSSDLTTFLTEAIEETDNKYFTFAPKCADGGKYKVKVDFVTCDFPGHDEDLLAASSIPEDILKKFNDMIDSFYKDGVLDKDALNKLLGITNANDKTLNSNSLMREAFFKKYGGWIEGIGVDGMPIYFKFHKTVDGILVYANRNSDFKNGGDWAANYVYNASTSKWYYGGKNQWESADNTTSVANINNDIRPTEQAKANEQKILDKITDPSQGWTEVTLNGNTFSK
ncbi:prepilin-type N-terminal cleavage/methylation domain-containing protein [Phascolarctobacterium faecium]|uniref:prepilin-type N-terminal cleavage/methylation domain-containing protein n=1 Tax=Phascolarctobacterium faecium TaxID=33025 RepID=UPI0026652B05|nr:prepilin-type N-terminal cleavage/methylation domain-containing protein [Phascolarctobacterium faecium]